MTIHQASALLHERPYGIKLLLEKRILPDKLEVYHSMIILIPLSYYNNQSQLCTKDIDYIALNNTHDEGKVIKFAY